MEEKESRANENSQSRRQKFADKAKGYRYAIFGTRTPVMKIRVWLKF